MRGGVVRGKAIPVSLSTTQGKEKERGLCLLVRRENRYKVDRQGRENGHIAVVAVALAAATAAGERKRKGKPESVLLYLSYPVLASSQRTATVRLMHV